MVKKAPEEELYVEIFNKKKQIKQYECCSCGREFRNTLLASVHIYQRHPELRVVKKQLGYLDGLLPPKPLAAFAKKTTERKLEKVEKVAEKKV